MQDFIDQANKNGVTLLDKGICQFCGADLQGGVYECMDTYSKGLDILDLNNSIYYFPRFLSVDAHALQHPEIHGRWSNHFHLTRLNLIIERKVKWDYKKSPLLSNYLNEYKLNRPNEILIPPALLKRGKITTKDLTKATTADACVELMKNWAEEVYHSWSSNHLLVSKIADGFISKGNEKQS
jgi:hypothetical protein